MMEKGFEVLCLAAAIFLVAGQNVPAPRLIFETVLPDVAAVGIVSGDENRIYVSSNEWRGAETSRIFVLNANTGNIQQSQEIPGKVGSCMSTSSSIIVNPAVSSGIGIQAIDKDTLNVQWKNAVVRTADKGIAPVALSDSHVLYYSSRRGLVSLDVATGHASWAMTTIRTGSTIAVTNTTIFILNQNPKLGFPLEARSITTGILQSSTGPTNAAATGAALAGDWIYTVRSDGKVYRSSTRYLFAPPTELADGTTRPERYGPLISPDGSTVYITNPTQVLIQAFSLAEGRSLWSVTVCPSLQPILRKDGSAIYVMGCNGALLQLSTQDASVVWSMPFPPGFIPASIVLSDDEERIHVAGSVLATRTGYAYSVFTGDASVITTEPPSSFTEEVAPLEDPGRGARTTKSASSRSRSSVCATLVFLIFLFHR